MLITESTELLEDVIVCATIETVSSITASKQYYPLEYAAFENIHKELAIFIYRVLFSTTDSCVDQFSFCVHISLSRFCHCFGWTLNISFKHEVHVLNTLMFNRSINNWIWLTKFLSFFAFEFNNNDFKLGCRIIFFKPLNGLEKMKLFSKKRYHKFWSIKLGFKNERWVRWRFGVLEYEKKNRNVCCQKQL